MKSITSGCDWLSPLLAQRIIKRGFSTTIESPVEIVRVAKTPSPFDPAGLTVKSFPTATPKSVLFVVKLDLWPGGIAGHIPCAVGFILET